MIGIIVGAVLGGFLLIGGLFLYLLEHECYFLSGFWEGDVGGGARTRSVSCPGPQVDVSWLINYVCIANSLLS